MSWTIIVLLFIFQLGLMYITFYKLSRLIDDIHKIREWVMPFGENLMDIRTEMLKFTSDVSVKALPVIGEFRYMYVTLLITIFAAAFNDPIAWLPLIANVVFVIFGIVHLYELNAYHQIMMINIAHAEDEVIAREIQSILLEPDPEISEEQ